MLHYGFPLDGARAFNGRNGLSRNMLLKERFYFRRKHSLLVIRVRVGSESLSERLLHVSCAVLGNGGCNVWHLPSYLNELRLRVCRKVRPNVVRVLVPNGAAERVVRVYATKRGAGIVSSVATTHRYCWATVDAATSVKSSDFLPARFRLSV